MHLSSNYSDNRKCTAFGLFLPPTLRKWIKCAIIPSMYIYHSVLMGLFSPAYVKIWTPFNFHPWILKKLCPPREIFFISVPFIMLIVMIGWPQYYEVKSPFHNKSLMENRVDWNSKILKTENVFQTQWILNTKSICIGLSKK